MSYRGRSVFFVIINRFIDSLKPKNIKSNTKHMGSDYLGNNYFEIQESKQLYDSRKNPKRWFKPPNEELWDRPLPPEWEAWLRMTRKVPPTEEEIQYNRIIEEKKKQFDKNNKTDKIVDKSHPISSFPIHPEYDEKLQNQNK